MPKIVSELDRQTMRLQIISAAAHEFARVGFDSTRMEIIAEQAGIGKGTIYLYFASKQELFSEMLKEIAGSQLAEITRVLAEVTATPTTSLTTILAAIIGTFNRLGREHPDSFRIFSSSLYGVNRQFKDEAARQRLALLKLIEALLADFMAPCNHKDYIASAALLILNVCESLALQAQALGFEPDFIYAHESRIVKMLLTGLNNLE